MFNPAQLCIDQCPPTLRQQLHACDIEAYEYALLAWENCDYYMTDIDREASRVNVSAVADVTIQSMLDATDSYAHWDDDMMPQLIDWTAAIAAKYEDAAR